MTYVTVETTEKTVGSVFKNQSSRKKWLLSEAIINLVKVYVDCSVEDVLKEVHQRRNEILAAEDNSDKAQSFVNVWEEIHCIMR